jgi:organic hydroperoxide reductase OsmC/OhrA
MEKHESITRVRLTLEDGYRFVASFPDHPSIVPIRLDEAPPLGEGQGPNPAALLASSVGACLASSLLFCLRKARAGVTAVSVDVDAHIARNAQGRQRIQHIEVRLSPDVDPADLARLDRCDDLFEDFCTVTASIRDGIPVKVTLASAPEMAPVRAS